MNDRNDSGDSEEQAVQIREFFEAAFMERVSRSPQTLTALGIDQSQDRLDDVSDDRLEADRDLIISQLLRLKQFDFDSLSQSDQLNYRIFKSEADDALERYRFRHHDYIVNQKFGLHTQFPAFMINMHSIANPQDAENYIARLHAVDEVANQVIAGMERRESLGVIPPAFLFPQMIGDCIQFIGDSRSDASMGKNVLYRDFQAKLEKVNGLDPKQRDSLQTEARHALKNAVLPAYEKLVAALKRQQNKAPAEAGACSLPDGDEYYQMCLEQHTSTMLSADDIHRLGEGEVERIQREMRALIDRLGFQGSLQDFFRFVREHPDFYYPQTEQGRQTYLDDLNRIIVEVEPLLPELFNRLPEDALLVKAVEPHREKTAGMAFYEGPAPDGSRPGVFCVNLYDLGQLPSFTMEALAYHEALPGHHMQFSIANRLRQLPTFRRYADYNAYIEGWGLYAELIAKEIGLYRDPYSDFGRLAQELKRACRLVVDTGIHARRWTREQAIDYLYENIPSSRAQVVKEIDRYIVMPGQATSYTVGMSEILKMRAQARTTLGTQFDLREFHDELLRHGPLPLSMLEQQMSAWIGSFR